MRLRMEAVHTALGACAIALQPSDGALRNGISSHRVKNTLSFPVLDGFLRSAAAAVPAPADSRLFLGSIDGRLLVSARLCTEDKEAALPAVRCSKKRGRDDYAERAEIAVSLIRPRADTTELRAAVDLAKATIEELLRDVRGPVGEELFEACGLSLSVAEQIVASTSAPVGSSTGATGQRPRLIIAARLAAGVPVPVLKLKRALGSCFNDGMITVDTASLGPAYQLPLTAAGQAVENAGQRSVVLFAAVPYLNRTE